jgi:6-phosphogluconolactonase
VHQVSFLPGTTVLAAVDLGLDALVFYHQDPAGGLLSEASRLSLPAGLGPRHLTYGPDDTIWLVHELGNRVSVINRSEHTWTVTQTLSTLPDNWQGESTAAAIRTNGRFVFVTNRGHDSLAVFAADAAGRLTRIGIFPSQGNLPRDFALLPDGNVLVAHQGGDVTVLHWDEACLKLRSGDCSLPLPGAVCICLPPHVKE